MARERVRDLWISIGRIDPQRAYRCGDGRLEACKRDPARTDPGWYAGIGHNGGEV
jgi:hypothetical protein